MLAKTLATIARGVTARPRLTLSVALALCGLLALGAMQVKLVTQMTSLVADSNPAVVRFKALEEVFGATDLLFVAVEQPEAGDGDHRPTQRAIVSAIAEEVGEWHWQPADSDQSEAMISRMDGVPDRALEAAFQDQILPLTWLMLNDEGVDEVIKRLQPRRLAKRLEHPAAGGLLPDIEDRDPVGLWTDVYDPFWTRTVAGELPLQRDNGYLVSRELTKPEGGTQAAGHYMLLMLQPRRQSQDTAFGGELMDRLRALESRLEADQPGFDIHVIGGYPVADRDYRYAVSSAFLTLGTSLGGVLLLFAIAYRSSRLALMILVCLMPAVAATLGLATFAIGELTMLASGFAAVLIGLGVDFAIHLYNGYGWSLERLSHLANPNDLAACRRIRRDAAIDAMHRVGPGILAGALTSIGAFLTLMLGEYRGLAEMGAICGLGLTVVLVMLLVAVPAFLVLWGPMTMKPSRLMAPYGRSVTKRPRGWLILLLLILVGSVSLILIDNPAVPFDRNPRNLRPAEDAFYQHQVGFSARLGILDSGHQILFEGTDPEAVMRAGAALADAVERARPDVAISASISLDASQLAVGDTIPIDGGQAARDANLILAGRTDLELPDGRIWRVQVVDPQTLALIQAPVAGPSVPAGEPLVLQSIIERGVTTLAWYPSPARQRHTLTRLATEIDWDGIEQAFANADPTTAAQREPFRRDLAAMRERVERGALLLPNALTEGPLASLISQGYQERDGTVYLRVPLDLRHREGDINLPDIFAGLGLVYPDAPSGNLTGIAGVVAGGAGVPSMTHAIQENLIQDFDRMAAFGAIAVLVILLVVMHSIGDGLKAIASLAGGVAVTYAILNLTGAQWNLMNIAALPLVLGIGIDNGIHFVHALRRRPGGDEAVAEVVTEIGHPLLITAATSIIGFGSLMLNAFRGIQSFGEVVVAGIIGCLVVALIGQPLLALLTSHNQRKVKPGSQSDPEDSGRFHASAEWQGVGSKPDQPGGE